VKRKIINNECFNVLIWRGVVKNKENKGGYETGFELPVPKLVGYIGLGVMELLGPII